MPRKTNIEDLIFTEPDEDVEPVIQETKAKQPKGKPKVATKKKGGRKPMPKKELELDFEDEEDVEEYDEPEEEEEYEEEQPKRKNRVKRPDPNEELRMLMEQSNKELRKRLEDIESRYEKVKHVHNSQISKRREFIW